MAENRPRPNSARYTPVPTPMGTAKKAPRPTSIKVPTIALAMPPPGSPTGLGMSVKKEIESAGTPLAIRCHTMSASGRTTRAPAA